MGFENRDYTREGDYTGTLAGWGLDYLSPVVKWLIVANLVVFVLQIFLTRAQTEADRDVWITRLPREQREAYERMQADAQRRARELAEERGQEPGEYVDPLEEVSAELYGLSPRVSLIEEWLQLDTRHVVYRGQLWRLVTYAFCHERMAIWHLLVNLIALFWFGVTLETMYGQREFLLFYLAGAVLAALANVGLDLWLGSSIPTIGASGAVMAVLMLYAIHYPRNTIRVFWFFPLEVRWIVLLYVIISVHPLLLALAGNQIYAEVAHAAHLGGLAWGFVYWKFELNLERFWNKLPAWRAGSSGIHRPATPGRSRSPQRQMEDEVDEILAKISVSGPDSLSEHERRVLQRASERYKRKHS